LTQRRSALIRSKKLVFVIITNGYCLPKELKWAYPDATIKESNIKQQ